MDLEYDRSKNPIDLFKEFYSLRQPIKCSVLLLDIYELHQSGFRKAVLLNNCFPDPFNHKYNQETHDFTLLVLTKSIKLAINKNNKEALIDELKQFYQAYFFFYQNIKSNTERLNESKFMDYSLSEQIRMFGIYFQEQSRLIDSINQQNLDEKGYFTGMENSVSNQKADADENMLVSFKDSFETLLETYDTLLRYLYFKKSKDFSNPIVPEHKDITYIENPSFEQIIYIANQRKNLRDVWEKFVYSQWDIEIAEEKFTFSPKFKEEYKERLVAGYRRQNSLMQSLMETTYNATTFSIKPEKLDFLIEFNKSDISKIFSISKEKYFHLVQLYEPVIASYKLNMPPRYLELTLNDLKMKDIFKVFELLFVLANHYKENIYKDFNPEEDTWYKYLSPIVPIEIFIQKLTNYYEFTRDYSMKLIELFTFGPSTKGESDVFSRPLILINSDHALFSPVLIEQMNISRTIEVLISNYSVDISQIGIDFEEKIRTYLLFLSGIEVNTSKIEFLASDDRDVEFDFIGTFDGYLLLWEFKAMTTPYSDKKYLDCKQTIKAGVEQVNRRSRLLNSDWNKIKKLANIELPDEPFTENKIIKLVVTNIFDFNTMIYDGDVRIVDESTILKFFVNPKIEIKSSGNRKTLWSKKLWKSTEPTIIEFKEYLKNPITSLPYKECLRDYNKEFASYSGDIPYQISDQILIEDPVEYMKNTHVVDKKILRNKKKKLKGKKKYNKNKFNKRKRKRKR